jgi:hypothetical protein|tara:strand:+ start:2987 stop:3574 length:588 start_codon:yes stop_codon:yes gene_type:complete
MKKQSLQQIKFRNQYLYLIREVIDSALFFKKPYEKICLVTNGVFSNKVASLVKKHFSSATIDIVDFRELDTLSAKSYDLILAPLALQFMSSLKYDISKMSDLLNADGILLASGFNVLSANDGIIEFKSYLKENGISPKLINIFALGELVNSFYFQSKAVDRDNFIISGSKIEVVNLYCRKKELEEANSGFKIEID